jgi:hypothetical protein
MITLNNSEYRDWARASSNQMLRYDAELLQGNYEQAGAAIWEAGLLRLQMAQLSRREDDTPRAIADALSAASCFIKAGNKQYADRALRRARDVGPLPPERPDLKEALAERTRQLDELTRRQKQFTAELDRHPEWLQTASAEFLETTRDRLRDFPGWAQLYSVLAYLEDQQSDFGAAARHAELAAEFDPENRLLVCMVLLARAKVQPLSQVFEWGREQLQHHPDDVDVRIVLTYLQAVHARSREDQRAALATLEPLTRGGALSLAQLVIVVSLCALLARALGDDALHERATRELTDVHGRLAGSQLPKHVVQELGDVIEAARDRRGSPDDGFKEVEKGLFLSMAYAA